MSQGLENILIIKPSALGDIVLALPALSALRKSFPEAKISWLVRPEFSPILENHPHLDEIIHFDRKLLGKAWCNPRAFKALISLILQLRSCRFDVIFDFQGLFRTAAIAWLSGCKKRYGMANSREMANIFYTHQIEYNSDYIHLVDFYLKIVKASGAEDIAAEFVLPVNKTEIESAQKLLAENNIPPKNYIVLIPGSAHISKCWPTDRFAELADKISEKFNLHIVAVGTNSDKTLVEEIQNSARVAITNLAGRTSLKVLTALLKNARLVVSNDTGPGHIAAALGTPLVMMYSWSNPARIAPYGRPECMIAREPFGRGLKIKSSDPKHNVINISVEEVFEKACEQLNK